jgi:hypothetical protein
MFNVDAMATAGAALSVPAFPPPKARTLAENALPLARRQSSQ